MSAYLSVSVPAGITRHYAMRRTDGLLTMGCRVYHGPMVPLPPDTVSAYRLCALCDRLPHRHPGILIPREAA